MHNLPHKKLSKTPHLKDKCLIDYIKLPPNGSNQLIIEL